MEKTVLITGSSGGIGEQLCRSFKDNGYFVIGLDINDIEKKDHLDIFYKIDLTSEDNIKNIISGIYKLDVLINNAAYQICKRLQNTSYDDFMKVMNTNLTAPFLLYKYALPLLKVTKGSIINISSVHNIATSSGIGAYAISKSAIAGLTRSIAIESAEYGIRCNTISPGAIDTSMLRDGLTRNNETIESFAQKHLLGDIGEPNDIAEMALFLADNKRAKFITGSNFYVDGGATIKLSTE